MSTCIPRVWKCIWKPEEIIRYVGSRITKICELPDVVLGTKLLCHGPLTPEQSLRPQPNDFPALSSVKFHIACLSLKGRGLTWGIGMTRKQQIYLQRPVSKSVFIWIGYWDFLSVVSESTKRSIQLKNKSLLEADYFLLLVTMVHVEIRWSCQYWYSSHQDPEIELRPSNLAASTLLTEPSCLLIFYFYFLFLVL